MYISNSRDAIMPRNPPQRSELLLALPARVHRPRPVRRHMFLQPVRTHKSLLAQSALIRPHPGMTPQMHLQHIPIEELLPAVRTRMFLLPVVNPPEVVVKVPRALENLGADFTNASVVRVGGHVDGKGRRLPALVIAEFAFVKPLVAVSSLVDFQGRPRSETLAAAVANVLPYICVNRDFMLVESRFRTALDRTLRAGELIGMLHQVQAHAGFFYQFAAEGARVDAIPVVV